MTKALRSIVILLFGILILGCQKEPKVTLTSIEITSQADLNFVCFNITDSGTFDGNIIILTEEVLDYSCLSKIRHINGSLILNGPGTTAAFKDIESIVDGEVFDICDSMADTMYFPNLHTIETDLGIIIPSACIFNNVLYMPNIEELSGILVATPSNDESRSGTILGFDKVEEMFSLEVELDNQRNNVKIDGFTNLKKIKSRLKLFAVEELFNITDRSFNNLESAQRLNLVNSSEAHFNADLESLLPKLTHSSEVEIRSVLPENACYLKDHVQSGAIVDIAIRSNFGESYFNDDLLDLCK